MSARFITQGAGLARWTGRAFMLAALACASLAVPGPAAAEPLLVPGKTDIYQRVLTRPDATITGAVGGASVDEPAAFSAYYVFAREDGADGEWLQVGPARRGDPTGWVKAAETVEWQTTMVLAFNNPSDRLPVLFFDDEDSLRDLVESERLPALAPEYVDQARAGEAPAGSGVLSIEPREWVDLRDNFYLLPVLDAKMTFLATGTRASLVRVASIPLQEDAASPEASSEFRAGIMFVIDSTISMQPYIDRTREALHRIYEQVRNSSIGDKVSFGLVEFRDNTDAAPGLDYVTKVVAPLQIPPDHEDFLRRMDDVTVSTVTSAGFNEDGLAGVLAAIGSEDWKHFGGRYIIFISDAGVREPPDPLAATGMGPREINRLSRDKVIAVFSMLLATPAGTAYHARAEEQLRELSYWNDCTAAPFYSVPEGRLEDFGPTIDGLTRTLINQIEAAAASVGTAPAPASPAGSGPARGVSCSSGGGGAAADGGARDAFLASADDIGQAMQMAWLGRARGTTAPDVFEAWAPDFALDDPSRKAFEVRVLLTKKQLSRMAAALEMVLEAGQTVLDDAPERFFDQLRTVVARAARDPSALEAGAPAISDPASLDNLGDLLGEYLEDLPYSSQLMDISADTWLDASPSFQDRVLTTVRSKLRAYQHFHDDADNWVKLAEGAPEDEWVYPIPLDLLP
ncbi:hypothetical protein C882_2339 [Caenispirillum salinarum AK4]|uniref:VWFA domain-containing protein n=1 Tax=Caenispirillum salinarum AK4 TaxID=1238182 RepID=K9H3X4_9PROT|nr:vWA domain-containing protein [Caenispirillum salinarum]EKV32262.1 hypothetical protein C882_2339 [Caenispirillum salinarum AK4]